MLGALLLQLYEEIMGYPYGGGKTKAYPWLEQQKENEALAKDDDDVLNIIITLITTDGAL